MKRRILIIDDDEDVRNILAESIRSRIDCEVHEASDRAEARALLSCYSYSLVLTDLSFTRGRLEGLDVIEELAATPFRPGLIAYSGYEDTRPMALSKGADTFLPKPIPLDEICCVLEDILEDPKLSMPRFPMLSASPRLNELLTEGSTRAYLQPIYRIDCSPAVLTSVEFLTRGPAGSLFERPDVLFAYAREAHAEDILDRHCIQLALTAAVQIPAEIRLSLNVHATTLCKPPDFAEWLSETASAAGVDINRITIEIVEHSPALNQNAFFQTLAKLRELSVKIALDDVGVGHSNYQMMIDAHPNCFKLDRYLVNGCSTNQYRRAVVGSVAKLAADFGGTVVAEGVETIDDLLELKAQGIKLVQSFMFCPPKAVEDALKSVLANAARPCMCSLEPGTSETQCALKGLGLCLVDYPERDSRLACKKDSFV